MVQKSLVVLFLLFLLGAPRAHALQCLVAIKGEVVSFVRSQKVERASNSYASTALTLLIRHRLYSNKFYSIAENIQNPFQLNYFTKLIENQIYLDSYLAHTLLIKTQLHLEAFNLIIKNTTFVDYYLRYLPFTLDVHTKEDLDTFAQLFEKRIDSDFSFWQQLNARKHKEEFSEALALSHLENLTLWQGISERAQRSFSTLLKLATKKSELLGHAHKIKNLVDQSSLGAEVSYLLDTPALLASLVFVKEEGLLRIAVSECYVKAKTSKYDQYTKEEGLSLEFAKLKAIVLTAGFQLVMEDSSIAQIQILPQNVKNSKLRAFLLDYGYVISDISSLPNYSPHFPSGAYLQMILTR